MIEEFFQCGFGYVFIDKYEDLRKHFEWPTSTRAVFIINKERDYYSTRKVNQQPRSLMYAGNKVAVIDEDTSSLVVLRKNQDTLVRAFKWLGWRANKQITVQPFEGWSILNDIEDSSRRSIQNLKKIQKIAHKTDDLENLYDYIVVGGRKIRDRREFKEVRSQLANEAGNANLFKDEFLAAQDLPYVEEFLFHQSGFDVVLAENTIVFEGKEYYLPPLAVRFLYYGRRIDCHTLSPLRLAGHPHTSRSGTGVCLGQFQGPLYDLLNSGRIRDAMGVLWEWKNHYNQNDPYRMIYDFKVV